jgi:hypothetical protein
MKQMAKTQKNKATSFHLGQLKAKLAKLKRELLTPASSGGGGGAGFDVARTGVASVGFIGFPSVGKSTLMSKLTGQHSEVAAYEFTTLTYDQPSPKWKYMLTPRATGPSLDKSRTTVRSPKALWIRGRSARCSQYCVECGLGSFLFLLT